MTAGTAIIMWLGELITQRGIGNGMSLIIFVSIVSQLPTQFGILRANSQDVPVPRRVVMLMLVLTVGIIFIDQGQRRIPISVLPPGPGPQGPRWPEHLHPAEGQHGRRHPGHLRHQRSCTSRC